MRDSAYYIIPRWSSEKRAKKTSFQLLKNKNKLSTLNGCWTVCILHHFSAVYHYNVHGTVRPLHPFTSLLFFAIDFGTNLINYTCMQRTHAGRIRRIWRGVGCMQLSTITIDQSIDVPCIAVYIDAVYIIYLNEF